MTRTHYFTATSLDGFIATEDHSLDWLLSQENDPHGPMGYLAFEQRIGAIAMGASSYQWLLDHADWPYTMPTWVLHPPRLPSPARQRAVHPGRRRGRPPRDDRGRGRP